MPQITDHVKIITDIMMIVEIENCNRNSLICSRISIIQNNPIIHKIIQ